MSTHNKLRKKPTGKKGQGKRRAKLRQKEESEQNAEQLGIPQSLADDEDGDAGTKRNLAVISEGIRRGYKVPDDLKPALVDYQIRHALSDENPDLAMKCFGALLRGEQVEQKEEELRLKREELELKKELMRRTAPPVPIGDDPFRPRETDLAQGIKALLESVKKYEEEVSGSGDADNQRGSRDTTRLADEEVGQGDSSIRYYTGSTVAGTVEGNADTGPLASKSTNTARNAAG